MSNLALQDHISDFDESGSSYVGSGLPSPTTTICLWRTPRFYDQECERFFDCPTHIVERCLSADENDDTEEAVEGSQLGHVDTEEGGGSITREPVLESPIARDQDGSPDVLSSSDLAQRISSSRSVTDLPCVVDSVPRGSSDASPSLSLYPDDSNSHEDEQDVEEVAGPSDTRSAPLNRPLPPPRSSSLAGLQHSGMTARSATAPVVVLPQPPWEQFSGSAPSRLPASTLPMLTRLISRTTGGADASSRALLPQARRETTRRANQELPASPLAITRPRWQPDNEETFCPICRTQFSIFVRKHHCRKCGRVVCNSCSPHRIVIPHQFIVQPHGQPRRHPSYSGRDEFDRIGGGERVRLCNPCVPDPNTTPPQTQGQGPTSPYSPRSPPGHYRSHSNADQSSSYSGTSASLLPIGRVPPLFSSRNRSITVAGAQNQYLPTQYHQRPHESRILSETPPVPRHLHDSEAEGLLHMYQHSSLMDVRDSGPSSSQAGPSIGAVAAGPSRYYQIPEEDECPVCHRELPPTSLSDFEILRESHITMCIQAHSHYGDGSGSPIGGVGDESSSSPPGAMMRRATGMFPYKATEKDCVDSAECTICLEEFEVGVGMSRLECLCRFHRKCILAWWKKHPGRCPVHQHDALGF